MSVPPPPAALSPSLSWELQIDPVARQVSLNGAPVKLGGRAFDLLAAMAARPGRVFTVDELQEAAWPGRVLEESNLRAQIRQLRKTLGEHRVVNVSGRGYAFIGPDAQDAPVAVASSSALPAPSTALLGREDDTATMTALLARHRLVTLLGAGGMGKTQLALALAHRARAEGRCEVWWVELAPLRNSDQLALAVAHALRLQPSGLTGPGAQARLGAAVAGHEGLLVLDNAEALAVELAALLQTVLPLAPGLRVLVTSQQRLHLPAEQVYRLEPLPTPAAVALLLQRAQGVDHRYTLGAEDAERAAVLCEQLDRLPLALEMAGARLPTLGLRALTAHLGDRLRLLRTDLATAPRRQQTLQAALEWSHALLTADEHAVLRRLSVFGAAFTLASAQTVAADAALDAVAVAQAVAALVDKSLLQAQAPGTAHAEQRFRLLETTRLFAAQQLQQHGERPRAEAQHARAMATRAEVAQAAFWASGDREWASAWRADHDDFVLGFDHACTQGDAESAAVLLEALQHDANLSGLFDTVQDRVDGSLALLPLASPLARARLWNRGTLRCRHLTKVEAARRRVQAWRLAGEPMALVRALAWCAKEEFRAGQLAPSSQLLTEARALEQAHWPPRQLALGVAQAELDIAALRNDAPSLRQAALARQALAERGGLVRLATQATNSLAIADILQGQPERALRQFQQTATQHRALGSPGDTAYVLCNQVILLSVLGQTGPAINLLGQALLTTGERYAMARLTEAGATLALTLDECEQSARWLAAAKQFEQHQASPAAAWKDRILDDTRCTLAERLDPAARERCRLEGAVLDTAAAHHQMLEWVRATQKRADEATRPHVRANGFQGAPPTTKSVASNLPVSPTSVANSTLVPPPLPSQS